MPALVAWHHADFRGIIDSTDDNVLSSGMADFFGSLNGLEDEMPDLPIYLSSHPDTQEQADLAAEFAKGQELTSPVLDDVEWSAWKAICD